MRYPLYLAHRLSMLLLGLSLAAALERFADRGWLNMVGGCCGTGPEHIGAVAEAVSGIRPERRVEVSVVAVSLKNCARPRPPPGALAGPARPGQDGIAAYGVR